MDKNKEIRCCAVAVKFTSQELMESEIKRTAEFAKRSDCLGVHPNNDPKTPGDALYLFTYPEEIAKALDFIVLCRREKIDASLLPNPCYVPADVFGAA